MPKVIVLVMGYVRMARLEHQLEVAGTKCVTEVNYHMQITTQQYVQNHKDWQPKAHKIQCY